MKKYLPHITIGTYATCFVLWPHVMLAISLQLIGIVAVLAVIFYFLYASFGR